MVSFVKYYYLNFTTELAIVNLETKNKENQEKQERKKYIRPLCLSSGIKSSPSATTALSVMHSA